MNRMARAWLLFLIAFGVAVSTSVAASISDPQPTVPFTTTAGRTDHRQHGRNRRVSSWTQHDNKEHYAVSLRGGIAAPRNNNNNNNELSVAVLGAVIMASLELVVKNLLTRMEIAVPSQLAACLVLLITLLLLEKANAPLAHDIFTALTPGAALLAKWLPVFFVPALVLLPLSPPIGNASEIAKVVLVCGVGFVYTVTTTLTAIRFIMKLQGKKMALVQPMAPARRHATSLSSSSPPFSAVMVQRAMIGASLLGAATLGALRTAGHQHDASVAKLLLPPLNTAFLLCSTVFFYVGGARLPPQFVQLVHPLVTSSVGVLAVVRLMAAASHQDYRTYLRTFKVGTLDPRRTGAGDVLLYLLGPSVVSFAVAVYSRRQLLATHWSTVVTAMLVSSVGGLYGTAAFVRLIQLGEGKTGNAAIIRLSVLARNVTTALSMALTAMLGGDISIAAAVVSLTGIIGASYAKPLMNALGVHDPILRGLAVGSSSQGLGVASLANEVDAFPFAAIAMVMTAIAATTIVSIPAVKDSIIQLATGNL